MRSRTIAALIAPTFVGFGMLLAPAAQADCPVTGAVLGCTAPAPQPSPGPAPSPSPQPSPAPQPSPTPSPSPAPLPAPTPQPSPGPGPQPSPGPQPGPQPSARPDTAWAESRLLDLVNRERQAAGLPALARRGDVDGIARQHSGAMAAKGELWHNDDYFTPASRDRLGAKALGENVAMDPDVEAMHRALMNSPHHRANILDPRFRQVGMGVVFGAGGSFFATQDFVEPRPGTAPAPSRVAEAARGTTGVRKASVAAAAGAGVPEVADAVAVAADGHGLAAVGFSGMAGVPGGRGHRSGGASRGPLGGLALLSLTGLAGVGKAGIAAKRSTR